MLFINFAPFCTNTEKTVPLG